MTFDGAYRHVVGAGLSARKSTGIKQVMMKIALMTAAIVTLGACSSSGSGHSGEDTYTLDLATYSPEQSPSALWVSNETLTFPLGVGPTTQALSASAPGDLIAHYTRVGCWVDPDRWIGTGGTVPVQLPASAPVRLLGVTVHQLGGIGVVSSLQQLANETCVTFRLQDGTWHSFSRASTITEAGDSVRSEFTLDAANATAVAIFLPTYTYVSKVTYRVALE